MKSNHIPFWLVVVMNINVMIGAGVFVNTASLTKLAGPFGAFSYIVVGWMILPLVLVIAELAKINPASEGALLTYSKEAIGPWAGYLSVGGYAFVKTVSCAVLSRVIADYLQNVFPILSSWPDAFLIVAIILLFNFLNLFGMKFGSKVQLFFVLFKMMPILFTIIFIGYVFNVDYLTTTNLSVSNFTSSLPIALYAFIGFETCCAIGHAVQDGKKMLSKAVVTSFLFVVVLFSLFQFALYNGVGPELAFSEAPLSVFFNNISTQFPLFNFLGKAMLNSFITVSLIGSFYGIMQANNWNLFALAREFKMQKVTTLNNYGTPYWCVALQCVLCTSFALSSFSIINLQRVVVFGVVNSYFLCVVSLICLYKTRASEITLPKPIAYLSIFSCIYMFYQCVKHLI